MNRPSRHFRFWPRKTLVEFVMHLEQAQATGAKFVNYVGLGGSVSYVDAKDFDLIIGRLYDRIDQIDGIGAAPKVRHVRVVPWKGF